MKADTDLIQGKIDIIEQNLKFLEKLKKEDYKIFEKDYGDILAAKHAL